MARRKLEEVEEVLEPTPVEPIEEQVEEEVLEEVERFPKYHQFLRENPNHVPEPGEHLKAKFQ